MVVDDADAEFLLRLDRESFLHVVRGILDSHGINTRPGGHGERSVAVGAVDMALWDLTAKVAGLPLCRLLANRYHGGVCEETVWLYAAGGYYHPGKDPSHSSGQA